MAMAVIHPFVAPFVLSAKGCRDNMIYFKQITVTKVESTSWALSLLTLARFCGVNERGNSMQLLLVGDRADVS